MRSTIKVVAVAMAAVMTVGSLPAEATRNGLSAKQIKALIKQEVAKAAKGLRGPRGAQGPAGAAGAQGPAGMDGMQFLFAAVASDGFVFDSNGITNENIRREEGFNITRYCFFGLPPVVGGQVTLLGGGFSPARIIDLNIVDPVLDPDCPVLVQTSGVNRDGDLVAEDQSFYILLYGSR